MSFTARTMEILRSADRRISSSRPGASDLRSEACRHALRAMAQVDSFYLGTFTAADVLTIDYVFDHGEPYGGDVIPYGPGGLSDFIRSTARTYTWHHDGGLLVANGLRFGERADVNRDAVAVPIVASDGTVTGMLAALSYRSDAFDAEFVEAAEWLATALAVSNDHRAAMLDRLDLSAIYPDQPTEEAAEQMVITARQSLTRIDHHLQAHARRVGQDDDLDAARRTVLETIDYLAPKNRPALRPTTRHDLSRLTSREREIADVLLTAGPLTNQQLAHRFGVSLYTIKGHVAHILAKLELEGRQDLFAETPQDH